MTADILEINWTEKLLCVAVDENYFIFILVEAHVTCQNQLREVVVHRISQVSCQVYNLQLH